MLIQFEKFQYLNFGIEDDFDAKIRKLKFFKLFKSTKKNIVGCVYLYMK